MAYGDRVPSEDFETLVAAGDALPRGIWGDESEGLLYLADSRLSTYSLLTKAAVEVNISAPILSASGTDGLWGNSTHLYIGLFGAIRAYARSDLSRDVTREVFPSGAGSHGFWGNSTTLYSVRRAGSNSTLRAYNINTGARVALKDISLNSDNDTPTRIWGNSDRVYVGNDLIGDRKVFAYDIATGLHVSDFDIDLGAIPTIRGLWGNSEYLFVASSAGTNGKIYAYSIEVVVTPDPPSTPSGLSAAPDDSQITLSWNSVSTATAYDVRYREAGTSGAYTVISGITTTGVLIDMLDNALTYEFQIRAENSGGESAWSGAIEVELPTVVSVPVGLTISPGDEELAVSWNPVNGATFYDLRYRIGIDAYTNINGLTVNSRSVGNLQNGTTYRFSVRARNSISTSDWSAEVIGTPDSTEEAPIIITPIIPPPIIPPPQAPPPIPGMLVGTARDKQVAVVWVEAPRAETYDLRYRRTTLPQGVVEEWAVLTDITAEAKVVEGLLNDVSYDFAVRAVNVFGESLWSEPISVTPIPSTVVPDRPDNLMVTADNAQVDVEWDLVTGAQYYDLQYKLNSDSDYTRIRFYASDLPVTIDRLENGSVYNFRVRAGNSAGNSLYSSVVNATPAGSTVSPDRPSNLRVVRNLDSSDQVDISWFDPNGSGRVEIEYRKDSEINWTNTGQLTNQYPPYTLTVDLNVRYRFRIRAWNTTDNSAWSPEADYILLAATSVRGVQRERAIIIKFEHDARGICSGGRIITLDDVEKYGSFRGLTFEPWIQISSDLGSDAIAQHSITPSVQIKIPLDDIPDWVENRTVGEDIIAAYIEKFSVNDEWELTDYGYIGVLDRFNQHAENFNFTFISPLERVTKEDPNLWSDFAHQSLYEGDLWFSDLTGLSLRGPYVRFP